MQWTVESIPQDATGLALYLDQYKPFRLLSLRNDPSAFGSTLAREQAFDDEQWRDRLFSPQATTFVARETTLDSSSGGGPGTQDRQRRLLSSITLIGPDLETPDLVKPRISSDRPVVLHWRLNGVFTHPDARRRGIAAALMEATKRHAWDQAAARDSDGVMTVVVYTGNGAAKSWYEKMGFEQYNTSHDQGRPTSELFFPLLRPRPLGTHER